jgi:hypothetical protein
VSKPNDAINLPVVYEDAGAGRLTASIPVVPGTISWGRTQAEARGNVVDALGTMLSVGPEDIRDHATAERVRITLAPARRQKRDLGLDRELPGPDLMRVMAASKLDSPARSPPSVRASAPTPRLCPLSCPPAPANARVEPKHIGIIIRVSGVRVPPPA